MCLILYLLFGFISASVLLLQQYFLDSSSYVPVSVLIVLLGPWALLSWRFRTHSFFDPFSLFFLSAMLFNGGHAFLHVFGFDLGKGAMYLYYNAAFLRQVFVLIFAALYFLGLGGILSSYRRDTHVVVSPSQETLNAYHKVGGWLLMASAVPMLIDILYSLDVVRRGGYFALYQQPVVSPLLSALRNISKFLFPALFCLLIANRNHPHFLRMLILIVSAYAAAYFVLGARSSAILPLLAFFWIWHVWVKPVPRWKLIAAALFFGCVVFPLVAMTRNDPTSERGGIQTMIATFFSIENPLVSTLTEMGSSSIATAGTVELVPRIKEHGLGVSYVNAVLYAFLPSRLMDIENESLSYWLVSELQPEVAEKGGGLGFSFVAEAYYNFGVFGIVFVPLLLGWLLGRAANLAIHHKTPGSVFLVGMILMYVPYFARSPALSIFPYLIRYFALPMLLIWIVTRLQRHKKASVAVDVKDVPQDTTP